MNRSSMESMDYSFDMDLELCPVCGDTVSGYHYGLLTCESCKGFFKRTVQNNKKYICAENQDCQIDKMQRKRCPFCRFQKCLHVGMRLEAVRADRMRGGRNKFGPMYKRDRALKQQKRALIQSRGLRMQTTSMVLSSNPMECTFSGGQVQSGLSEGEDVTATPHYVHARRASTLAASFSGLAIKWEQRELYAGTSQASFAENCTFSAKPSSSYASLLVPDVSGEPQLILELLRCDLDDLQVRGKINGHLQRLRDGWGSQEKPSTFGLTCLMIDQTLFYVVEWARGCIFFKELKVSDQMKLLHNCWCELLALDFIYRQVQHGKEGSMLLVTGQEVELPAIMADAEPVLNSLVQKGQALVGVFQSLQIDRKEIACFKFLILFNPDVNLLENKSYVENIKERVHGALLEYTLHASPQRMDKFSQLLLCLSDLRAASSLAEDYLCSKHICGEMPCNNLLIEMLYAKHNCL